MQVESHYFVRLSSERLFYLHSEDINVCFRIYDIVPVLVLDLSQTLNCTPGAQMIVLSFLSIQFTAVSNRTLHPTLSNQLWPCLLQTQAAFKRSKINHCRNV